MTPPARKGTEEARNQLPDLLTAAENGRSTIITKHGRPVAAVVPKTNFEEGSRQKALLSVKGSGRGLWGDNSRKKLRKLHAQTSSPNFGLLGERDGIVLPDVIRFASFASQASRRMGQIDLSGLPQQALLI